MINRNSKQDSYEAPSPYPLPMHSGPPSSRYSSSSSPAPPSPYVEQSDSRQGYQSTAPHSSFQSRQGESSGLPPPPPPYYNQYNTLNGHQSSYDSGSSYSNGDAHCGDAYYSTSRPQCHSSSPTYNAPSYSYQVSPTYNGHYSSQNGHPYQNGYHWPVQFESEDMTSQVPKKRRGNLPRNVTDLLKTWFEEHLAHPYPTEEEKQMLCSRTGLAMTQVSTSVRMRCGSASGLTLLNRSATGSSTRGDDAFLSSSSKPRPKRSCGRDPAIPAAARSEDASTATTRGWIC